MARDLTCSAILLAIAGTYYALASRIGSTALADEVGPDGLPLAYAVLLGALGAALGIKTLGAHLLRRDAVVRGGARGAPLHVLARAAGTLALGGVYVAVLNVLGYWLSLALLLPAMAAYQGQAIGRGLLIVTLAGATAFWLMFVWLLGIPMPGPWFLGSG